MKKSITLLLIVILSVTALMAEDVYVDYVDGYLELKDGSSWMELWIGDEIGDSDILKLGRGSYAELSYGSDRIKLSRPGVYELSSLLGARKNMNSSGVGALLAGKFKTLLIDDSTKTEAAVGGVRAAEAETVSVDWMTSETAEIIRQGRNSLQLGVVDKALDLFNEALDLSADEYEESEAYYYIGLAHAMSGNYGAALENLDFADFDTDSEYYSELYILKGQLLVESSAYEEAVKWLNSFKFSNARAATTDDKQQLYLMLAVAQSNSGMKADALKTLDKLISLDRNSEAARAAVDFKNSL